MVAILILTIVSVLLVINTNTSSFGEQNTNVYTNMSNVNEQEMVTAKSLYNKFKKRFRENNLEQSINRVDMVYAITMPQRTEYITKQINKLG